MKFRNTILLGVMTGALAAGIMTGARAAPARASTCATDAQMAAGVAAVIHTDGMTSAADGTNQIYTGGDTNWVSGDTVSGGFDHFELIKEVSCTGTFVVQPGHGGFPDSAGHKWQQFGCLDSSCPRLDANWSDGTFFWPGGIFADGTSLWVIGVRVTTLGAVHGSWLAQFNASTLAFDGITQITGGPGADVFSGVEALPSGRYVIGTHFASDTDPEDAVCDAFGTNCKQADMLWIPNGGELNQASWALHSNVMPTSLNVSTTISSIRDSDSGGYLAWTKNCDICGGTQSNGIQEMSSASSLLSGWALDGTVFATTTPTDSDCNFGTDPCPASYGVTYHAGDSPAGKSRVSYNVNDFPDGTYDPVFLDVTP